MSLRRPARWKAPPSLLYHRTASKVSATAGPQLTPRRPDRGMARYRRRDAIETRLAEDLAANGRAFTADLIAKRATGVAGYRVTLAFFEVDGPRNVIVDLSPAQSREEVAERARTLSGDVEGLLSMLRKGLGEAK